MTAARGMASSYLSTVVEIFNAFAGGIGGLYLVTHSIAVTAIGTTGAMITTIGVLRAGRVPAGDSLAAEREEARPGHRSLET